MDTETAHSSPACPICSTKLPRVTPDALRCANPKCGADVQMTGTHARIVLYYTSPQGDVGTVVMEPGGDTWFNVAMVQLPWNDGRMTTALDVTHANGRPVARFDVDRHPIRRGALRIEAAQLLPTDPHVLACPDCGTTFPRPIPFYGDVRACGNRKCEARWEVSGGILRRLPKRMP